jgi:ammonium transporter Rh
MTVSLSTLLGVLQFSLVVLFLTCTEQDDDNDFATTEYIVLRDIMVMLLLGFGFLMTFLKKYGLSAVGLTMLLTAVAVQLNLLVEPLFNFIYRGKGAVDFPLPINLARIIDGEFAAATLLISFGAIIGRATPVQLLLMAVLQSFFYSMNKVVVVFGALQAEDVGGKWQKASTSEMTLHRFSTDTRCTHKLCSSTGTITIHLFGAYFGIAVSKVFRSPKSWSYSNATSNAVSDVFAMIGTTVLWVYWPSFVGATETANPENENRCLLHTVLALVGSTGATFWLSSKIVGKFDPVHIANSTLAGGVAVGASARLGMSPGGALLLGVVAGIVSVSGYVYVTPLLEQKVRIHDTCGVHNLHGLPAVLGGLASAVFVTLDDNASFLGHSRGAQAARQVLAVVCTMVVALVTGWMTGVVMVKAVHETPAEYDDAAWWKSEYFDDIALFEDDKSTKSRASVTPVESDENA